MTLGVSTVTLGALTVYSQKRFLSQAPAFVVTLGSERFATYIPYDLLVWAPISALIILGLRYSGFGRMIYAVGDNPVATRLAGVRNWQVLLAVYALCGLLSARGRNPARRLQQRGRSGNRRAVPAAVGGSGRDRRHVDLRRARRLRGNDPGALILTLLDSLLTILNASQAVRQILYGLIVLVLAAIYARTAAAAQ